MSKPPKLSQKEHDAITARADKMFAGSREELANAGFGVAAKKANQQTATNLNTVRSNVIDSDVAFSLGYSDYSLSYDSNADLNAKAYYAAQSNELTSNLSSDLHYRENKFLSQMWQITASGDAAYQAGLNRGYVSAAMGRPGALNSLAMQKQSMIDFAVMNQQQYAYDQANPIGSWSDLAWGAVTKLGDMGSQLLQGTAQLITQGPAGVYSNGGFETYSFLGEPTNQMESAGRFMSEVVSYGIAPEAALFGGARAVKGISSMSSRDFGPRTGSDIVTHQKLLDEYHLQDIERSRGLSRQTGLPMYRKDNLGVVQEFDAYGNEIMYRGFSDQNYKEFLQTGRIPATRETFISPLEAYSRDYDGVLMRHTVQPGTMDKLLSIGGYGNKSTLKYYPNLPHAASGWGNNVSQIKLEGQYKIHVNNGKGIINTGLGQGSALDVFNNRIIKSQLLY